MAHIARVGSVLATLLVTIERFVAVVYPLKRMTKSTSVSLIYCSIIIAISYNIPRFFEFDRITVEQTQNITSPAMATNPTHNMKLLKVLKAFSQSGIPKTRTSEKSKKLKVFFRLD